MTSDPHLDVRPELLHLHLFIITLYISVVSPSCPERHGCKYCVSTEEAKKMEAGKGANLHSLRCMSAAMRLEKFSPRIAKSENENELFSSWSFNFHLKI
jgi:hypothetical protein